MGHLSIAILKKQSISSSVESPKYDYLVIKTNACTFKFFDKESNAIGGTFDYTVFKRQINDYFTLPQDIEVSPGIFENVDFSYITLFKTNKRDPYASSYEYILSYPQIDYIKDKMKTKNGFWNDLVWMSEEQLFSMKKKWNKKQIFIFEKETAFNPPKFSNEFRADLKNIVKAKESGKLVIFAGAGVSIDSNVPGWSKLIDELKGDLDKDDNDFLSIGQLYYNARGKKEYIDKIQDILKHGKTNFNPIHEKIIELQPLHILTTNYDTHFENALNDKNYRYSIVKKDADLPYSKGASLFIKMHGDFDEKNLVLKKEDYGEGYSSNFPLIEGFVKGIFASKLVLFIGFSFSDPNLIEILKFVRNILREDNQPPYLLAIPKENASNQQQATFRKNKQELEKKGVKVVKFESKPIDDYFDQVLSEEDKKRTDELSAIGQKVYKFLKVTEEFDTFSDTLDNLNIDSQFTNSLLRFEGLGAIPPKVIESIAPFKHKKNKYSEISTDAYYDPYTPFHLETLNEDLLNFLKKKGKDGKVDFLGYSDKTLSINEQELNKAFKLLYSSGVHCIIRKNDTSPIHLKLNPINSPVKCNCSSCLYTRFNFNLLLSDLNTLSSKLICKKTTQDFGLIEAYGFLKTGQVVKAYYVLEELKMKTWKNQDFITYYLAIYNQTLLNSFMSVLYDRSLKEEEFEHIKQAIGKIDLNLVIFDLPLDSAVKDALSIIKENKLYHSARSEIEKEYSEIIVNYNKYKKGGYRSMGPHYWYNIETTFYGLWQFYNKNLIYNDEFSYFLDLAHIYIESMIVSFCTSEQYEQRLKHFSPFFIMVFIINGRPKDIKSLINEYDVSKFEFENHKKSVKEIIESFVSFCSSSFEINAFNNEVYKNPLFRTALSNSLFFETKTRTIFNNFLLLINRIDVTNKELNEVIEKAINFLITSPIFKAHKSHEYFTDFVTQNIKAINEQNTLRLLNYILSDNLWSDNLIEPICNGIINQQKKEMLLGEDYYKKVIRRTEAKDKWNVRLESMMPFYCLFKEEQRIKFLNDIRPLLTDNEPIKKAYYWGVWNPNNDIEIFNTFNTNLEESCKGFPDYRIRSNGLPENINSFSIWNDLKFFVSRVYEYNLLGKDFVLNIKESLNSKMFKWILDPNDFEYKDFELNWLIAFNNALIMDKLKKIDKLKSTIESKLQLNYNEPVAKIYFEKLVK